MHQVHQRIGAAACNIVGAQIAVILQHKVCVGIFHSHAFAIKLKGGSGAGASGRAIGDSAVADFYVNLACIHNGLIRRHDCGALN